MDPLDHPGNLTFPRDRDPRSSTTSHTQPCELGGGVEGGGEVVPVYLSIQGYKKAFLISKNYCAELYVFI